MTIIHYTLGLAPQRSGGLTRYATDLMLEQTRSCRIALLYPCGFSLFSREISWCKAGVFEGVDLIKLHNSYPVPLLYGVKVPADFHRSRSMSKEQMQGLYDYLRPDVFHVHTLMGLPKELLIFFKSKGVKLIFTSHDYFGLCPKVNFINSAEEVCIGASAEKCKKCNKNAKSTAFLRLRNSSLLLNNKKLFSKINK